MFESIGNFIDHRMVGDPRIGVDRSIFDQSDDTAEVAGRGVSASEDGKLASMENGSMGKAQVLLRDTDENNPACASGEFQGADMLWLLPVASITTSTHRWFVKSEMVVRSRSSP